MAGKILCHLGPALCVPPRSLLTVCAVALLRIRELGGIRCYSPRERTREREEGRVRGKERGREIERERVCRKSTQDAPYLPGTHGWISWGCLNVCERVCVCVCERERVCAYAHMLVCVLISTSSHSNVPARE